MAGDWRSASSAAAKAGRPRRGVAVMMVVLILAALISIAGPFAISMHLYERNARHFRDTARARLAAEGAVAHAISCLRRTEDAAELEGRYGAPWNTPDLDTQAELDVYFAFGGKAGAGLKKAGVKFDDPEGVIWSANVEDEQGKLNLISAPPRVLGNMLRSANLAADVVPGAAFMELDDASLFPTDDDAKTADGSVCVGVHSVTYTNVTGDRLEGLKWNLIGASSVNRYRAGELVYDGAAVDVGNAAVSGEFKTLFELKKYLSPRDFERIQPWVTVNSYRDASEGWLTRVEIEQNFNSGTVGFRVRSVAGFAEGARARFLVDDKPVTMNRILWARQRGQWGFFTLVWSIGFDRQQNPPVVVHVQAEQFHPVNVNTARPPVLTALFAGLGQGGQRVTRLEAEALADYIYYYVRGDERFVRGGRPVGSHADFRAMLEACRRSGWFENGLSPAKIDAIAQYATATICFKAFGNFTIEAAGAVNTLAGEESARYVVRELVTMPVESGGQWTIASQKDFDEQNLRLVGRKVETWPFTEPPTKGSGLDVYKRGFDPRTGRDNDGFVTLDMGCAGGTGVDHFDARSPKWQGLYSIQHHAAKLSGDALRAAGTAVFEKSGDLVKPFSFEGWFRSETGMAPGLAAGQADRNGFNLSYSTVGESGRPEYLLRVADACAGQGDANFPWRGPAQFRFEAPRLDRGDWYHLAMQLKGASPGEALVWMDGVVSRGSQTSYRPGTRLAQLLPLAVPKVGGDDSLLTEGDSVYVDDTRDFPPENGVIIIDGEVMEYETKTNSSFENCRRARRYTHLATHPVGAVVTPYGYSVPLKTDLFRGTGKLASALGPNPVSRIPEKLVPDPAGGDDIPDTLKADDTTIPVEDASDFQDSGFVCIGSGGNKEYVYFGKIDRNGDLLLECERGYSLNAGVVGVAREFAMNGQVPVTQISIACTGMENYKFYAQRTYDDFGPNNDMHGAYFHYASVRHADADDPDNRNYEWFRLEHRVEKNNITYVLGAQNTGQGIRVRDNMNWRGQLGTTREALDAGTPVLPVVQLAGPQCGDWDSRRGSEHVTPVQGERAEDTTLLITHSSCHQYRHDGSCCFVFRASFDQPIAGSTYQASNGRILKFPSGEFLRKTPDSLIVGGSNGSGFVGYVDEVRTDKGGALPSAVLSNVFTETTPPFTNNEPLGYASSATTFTIMAEIAADGALTPISSTPAVGVQASTVGGVVRIGDELIWCAFRTDSGPAFIPWGREQRTDEKYCPYQNYLNHDTGCRRRVQTMTLSGCVRGILGTDRLPSNHAFGERVTFFEAIPLTILTEAMARGSERLRVQTSTTFPPEGYALLTSTEQRAAPGRGEIVGWSTSGLAGCQYLRGRFGTRETAYYQDDFCQLLPFRYWDRWNYDFEDETTLAFFQCSYSARDARWQEIEWTESGYTGGATSDRVRMRIVCRFDGKPEWNERPTNRQGGLWEFRGGGRQSFRSPGGGPLIADSIEVRAYWEFLGGAWDVDANDWKRNTRLENLTVTFGNPLVVRKVDLLDY